MGSQEDMNFIYWFWLLVAGHCIADTTFQTDFMARGKNRHGVIDLSRVPKGQKPIRLWWMWLMHHAMVHGLIIYLLTGRPLLGMIETASHWIIDFGKCENWYNPYIDQLLHISMKVIYVIVITRGII